MEHLCLRERPRTAWVLPREHTVTDRKAEALRRTRTEGTSDMILIHPVIC